MNILICDDIRDEAVKLENAIREAQAAAHFEVNSVYFEKAQDVLEYIKKDPAACGKVSSAKIDVCFLDIIMPEMNGIELAANMRAAGFDGKIVFLTSSKDYGVESYQVNAYYYLLKPVNAKHVAKLLKEINNIESNKDTLMRTQQRAGMKIETRNMTRFVYFYEISFVEVINRNVYFHLLDGSEIVLFATLSEILPQLIADGRFAQCHRSYVVNMDTISQIRGNEIFLQCGGKTPISKSYKEFSDLYFKRVMGSDM